MEAWLSNSVAALNCGLAFIKLTGNPLSSMYRPLPEPESNTVSALARVIGGWQLGWITNVTSGAPLNMSANCGLYANCTPSEVNGGIDASSMDFSWQDDARNGQHFFGGERYTFVDDPQCTDPGIVDSSLQSLCNHQAVFDNTAGEIVLQNPLPGEMGNMAFNKFRDVKRWNVDMSASKGISVTEDVNFRFRLDISNIFNHPRPTAPSMGINGNNPLGQVGSKVGARTIQAMLRIDF